MSNPPQPGAEMFKEMLNALDMAVYTFDRNRIILWANTATHAMQKGATEGSSFGAAEENHFTDNEYYDIDGNRLAFPNQSVIEKALQGESTYDLLLEHRNLRDRTHKWVSISCAPVKGENGEFSYGILWYYDISRKKSRDDKLRFLIEATKILSITMEFEQRLTEKARLTVPSLADWASIYIAEPSGNIRRIALIHRDPKKIEWINEYEKKYPAKPGDERTEQRVVRTGKLEFVQHVTQEMIDAAPNLTDEQREDIRSLQLSSIMSLPIGRPGNVLGVLTLAYAESGRTYTNEDLQFFTEFANHLSVLVENARLYNEIKMRDEAKDTFLASLSHELRNPLAPIKASVELLQIQNQDETLSPEIDVLSHQFDHMARLLNDLLDATRFVQGKIKLEEEALELSEALDHVLRAARPSAEKAGVTLTVDRAEERLPVFADRTRIEQAFTNVLSNAVKFTPEGGTVHVTLREHGGNAVIAIKDSGAGITPEEMARIFDPYYQSERLRYNNAGLGIGLRLVYDIVQLHGGSIEARSEGPGQGSEFILSLPLIPDTDMMRDDTSMRAGKDETGKKILIVDDNHAAADGLVRLLNALGWSAQALYGATAAIDFLRDNTMDVVFLDLGMPEMSGYELVSILRAQGHTDLPIIALTGYGLEEDKKKAIEAGFTAHLTKPVGAKELRQVLTEVLP